MGSISDAQRDTSLRSDGTTGAKNTKKPDYERFFKILLSLFSWVLLVVGVLKASSIQVSLSAVMFIIPRATKIWEYWYKCSGWKKAWITVSLVASCVVFVFLLIVYFCTSINEKNGQLSVIINNDVKWLKNKSFSYDWIGWSIGVFSAYILVHEIVLMFNKSKEISYSSATEEIEASVNS